MSIDLGAGNTENKLEVLAEAVNKAMKAAPQLMPLYFVRNGLFSNAGQNPAFALRAGDFIEFEFLAESWAVSRTFPWAQSAILFETGIGKAQVWGAENGNDADGIFRHHLQIIPSGRMDVYLDGEKVVNSDMPSDGKLHTLRGQVPDDYKQGVEPPLTWRTLLFSTNIPITKIRYFQKNDPAAGVPTVDKTYLFEGQTENPVTRDNGSLIDLSPYRPEYYEYRLISSN
ncbi:hypothetical protein LO82_20260 [Vibrio vulnificus]|uniref:hypothetical protein n=1 Tax=Vibrio vulnificus TaxID=672 RepID=UPI0006AD26DD|nr:hypothetical protein [Vibrio vulnificus]KOR96033.1 hypothetical protein LO82_20260 [Vibrio vulnificus]